jgi:menaquinone-dependent protoporphyrinogen oxidase
MKAAVFFATREGQTRKIAERVAADLRAHGMDVDLHDVRTIRAPIDWRAYTTVFLAASVHAGQHEREMIEFVRHNRDELWRLGAAFLSVTLSEAGAEDPDASADRRQQSAADAQRMIEVFVQETGWTPARSLRVAGALAYRQYNLLIRFVMKRIARAQGAPTDTSRNYEFTNWAAVDRFVDAVAQSAAASVGS